MNKMNYKLVAWLTAVSIVILLICYVIEFDYIGNTIGAGSLMMKSMAFAMVTGIYIGYRFQKKGIEQVDKIRIWSASLLMPLFFAPWLGSLTNRAITWNAATTKSFEFVDEIPYAASAYGFLKGEAIEEDGCYLFIFYEGEIHRLKRKKCEFYEKENGDTISLMLKKGLWGYEVVCR